MPPIESLPNFERAYLMAQVQIARYWQFRLGSKSAGSDDVKLPSDDAIRKEEKRRFAQAMLSRVQDQAGAGLVQVSVRRLFDFRPLLQVAALAVCAIAPAIALAYFQPDTMRLACERLLSSTQW